MHDVMVRLPLTLHSHRARVCAGPVAAGGWDVTTEVDGRQIAAEHCSHWRHVEGYRARMQRSLEMESPLRRVS